MKDNLGQYLSNPENKAGVFNPATGDFEFAENHSQLQMAPSIAQGQTIVEQEDIPEFEREKAQLLAERDKLLKEEMGEQRRVKPVIDPNEPEGVAYKGKSGEEMVEGAEEEVGLKVHKIDLRIQELDEAIKSTKENIAKVKGNMRKQYLDAGMLVLFKVGDRWTIAASSPAQLDVPQSRNFLREFQHVAGEANVVVRGLEGAGLELNEAWAKDLDSFFKQITQRVKANFRGLSDIWLKREARKPIRWYEN